MTDRDRLLFMTKAIDDFKPFSVPALGGLTHSLESHFDLIAKRSSQLERAFYDFWNAGEVLWVSSIEFRQKIPQSQLHDIEKRLLPALRAALQKELDNENAVA
jgi:hypothetical protein